MEKLDLKKQHKALYGAPKGKFEIVEVPPLQYVRLDGEGDPNIAESYQSGVTWLYSVSYAMKFAAKVELGQDYVVGPLEALWWADDMSSFVARKKSDWRWTIMIMQPDFVTAALFGKAVERPERSSARRRRACGSRVITRDCRCRPCISAVMTTRPRPWRGCTRSFCR